jgi:hypothetical protein
MIEGLKLTMTGAQLIAKLEERIHVHETSTDQEDSRRIRLDTLRLIRDHIVGDEVYRLGEYDLKFADLLPEEDWLDCGCLGRWRHSDDDDSSDDVASRGVAGS